MLGTTSHSALPETLTRNIGEYYLGQARIEKEKGHLDVALTLYDQVKETLKSLGSVKEALRKAQDPQTLADETLRAMMAAAYFERGEVLENLNLFAKARISYIKAGIWGHDEAKHRAEASQPPSSGHSAYSNESVPVRTATPALMSVEEKSELVNYLFDKALSTLSSLEVSKKPSLFLVYAHDNPARGKADAQTSKYLIDKLFQMEGLKLHSDQAPMGRPYSISPEELKKDGKLGDIVTNQLCLLPAQLIKEVKPVDKVVVCSSEVLASYLEWKDYKKFHQELQEAYNKDLVAYRKDGEQKDAFAIRQVVNKFSQEEAYKAGFHHVLTEIAFLQIREKHMTGEHGIIPVSLTPNSYEKCLAHFIPATTVRVEDIPRLEGQAQAGREVHQNQSRHGVLFKLIERLLVGSNEAKTFLDKFWTGHGECISLLNKNSPLGGLEFAKLLDGIFDGIQTAQHSQLASIVKQQDQELWVLKADPLEALKGQYFAALQQDEAFKETLQLYVEPRGKASLDASETFKLLSKVRDALNEKQVVLLTGDSGAGKTTLNRVLENHLWEHKKEYEIIPLFISLPSIDKPEHGLIAKALKKRGLSEFQIQKLKKEKQRFVFILDGYDEIRQTRNLYLHNRINQSDGWQGHVVISCRSEYLGQDYQSRFQPNPSPQGDDPSFQEIVIEPFSEGERKEYIEKYVKRNTMGWSAQDYQEALEQPHLKALASNPFLLRVVLEALPYLENGEKTRTSMQLRLDLYGQFVRRWFERNQQRLSAQDLTGSQRETFRALCDDGFAQHGLGFVQDLAVHLYTENGGNPVIEYSLLKDKGNWKDTFFGREEEKQLLREAWPLNRSGNQHRFIHKSLLEYCVARALFESFDACRVLDSRPRRGSAASVYSFENQSVLPRRTLRDVSLAPKHWVGDLGIVRLLTERVQQEPTFKKQLLAIIERSKTDAEVRQAAANAITILVKAGERFNGADLQGIQIPGADLSEGEFDSVQLQGADLRKVTLRNTWLREANLNGAQMSGVQFGEWPTLHEESEVHACVYSPDGEVCAVGLRNGKISVYQTSNWEKVRTIIAHTERRSLGGYYSYLNSIAYSPQGDQLASGSDDETVRLWDVKTGACLRILKGDGLSRVNSVAYSPQGDQLASGSWDKAVLLWDVKTGTCVRTLSGHTDYVYSVAYSLQGDRLVSGSQDKTVRLWEVETGTCLRTLSDHTGWVKSVAYSPQGDQVASSSEDKTVRLWDVKTGACLRTLSVHGHNGRSVIYSPQGDQLAAAGAEVSLWEVKTGKCLRTLSGHTSSSVAYSPQGDQLASGSTDNTVRLWDLNAGARFHNLNGHTDGVKGVAYSPQGHQLVSGSGDGAVLLWEVKTGTRLRTLDNRRYGLESIAYSPRGDQLALGGSSDVHLLEVKTGVCLHTLTGHTRHVYSVTYSPQGDQLASGSLDGRVRLWDVQTGACLSTFDGTSRIVKKIEYIKTMVLSASEDDGDSKLSSKIELTPYVHYEVYPLSEHHLTVHSVAYSPQGDQLVAGVSKLVRVWDIKTGDDLHILRGHTNDVESVVYSPRGDQIASSSRDGTVRLWEANSGACLHTLSGHTDWGNSIVYSPRGDQLASSSEEGTVRLWDVKTGQCQKAVGDCGAVKSLVWKETPEGAYLWMGGGGRSVRQWEVKKEGEEYKVVLCWSSTHDELAVSGALIEGVRGLSEMNEKLLKQRGAVERRELLN
ncbi:MAG: WD40 repeat [Glomeribacter sp. 1016415]|nr:WD40 repeat [Glomeribacter sp. 1016415]